MKIDLEKYIRANRRVLDDVEHFDVDQMWDEFGKKKLPDQSNTYPLYPEDKTKSRILWYRLIAAVVIILLGTMVFLNGNNQMNQDDLVYQKLYEIDPDLAAEQVSMNQMVAYQDSLIKNLGITETKFPELFNEIRLLDSLQMNYLDDLDNYRDRKNLTRTLLRHYQRKARVFELMLYEFDKQENENEYETGKAI